MLGLSGGIDSALTATIASDALGAENVVGVLMPSEFSSPGSFTDAEQLAKHLGIETRTISINEVMHAFTAALRPGFNSAKPEVSFLHPHRQRFNVWPSGTSMGMSIVAITLYATRFTGGHTFSHL